MAVAVAAVRTTAEETAGSGIITNLVYLRSGSGRFVLLGTDRLHLAHTLRWAEDFTARVERFLRVKIPFRNRLIRIASRIDPTVEKGWTAVTREISGEFVVEEVGLYNADRIQRWQAEEALCSALLAGFVSADVSKAVPTWFVRGIVQNLTPRFKARNAIDVIRKWETGKLPGFCPLFRSLAVSEPDPALSGFLVAWLAVLDAQTDCFSKLLARLTCGESVDCATFAGWVPRGGSATELDEAWERWILRQRRIVYEPGKTDAAGLARLKAELLLYPGRSGIPLDGDPYRRMELRRLIERREEAWIAPLARDRLIALRLAAAGRGKALEDVADLYGRFFEALASGAGERALQELLHQAERGFARLEILVREQRDDAQDGNGP